MTTNRHLSPEEKEHIWNEYIRILPDVIEAQGLCNVVGGLANYVEDILLATKDSSKRDDLCAAWVSLDEATQKCDLPYE